MIGGGNGTCDVVSPGKLVDGKLEVTLFLFIDLNQKVRRTIYLVV